MTHGREKSDPAIVAMKPANAAYGTAAEPVERRAGAEGNAGQRSTHRAQNRASVSQGLDRIRQAARQRRKEKFTALFHHLTIDLLEDAFDELKADAAAGVDGLTWTEHKAALGITSRSCTRDSTGERIGRCRASGHIMAIPNQKFPPPPSHAAEQLARRAVRADDQAKVARFPILTKELFRQHSKVKRAFLPHASWRTSYPIFVLNVGGMNNRIGRD
jgi:hypothetical protein